MKYCPNCQTRYDEEIIRFCTKDGTPLVPEEEPNFIEMPSESISAEPAADIDDPDEVTVVRRSVPTPLPDDDLDFAEEEIPPRIVVPTTPEPVPAAASNRAYQAPPQRSNTALVVLVTFLGTIVVLGGAGLLFWMLQNRGAANTNTNANTLNNADTNVNTNLNIDSNFNFNAGSGLNVNSNANANANANVKTPTPTPKPTPSPSPSETPDNDNGAVPNVNASPTATPRSTPSASPTPSPPANRPVNAGSLNGRAVLLPTPVYPPAARAMRASGLVSVQVMLDENGNVISARAINGNPLLRDAAESAARRSRFIPIRQSGQPVKATGFINYNFVGN
jgi:TonB family protein